MQYSRFLNYCTVFGGTLDGRNIWVNGRIVCDACYRQLLNRMTNRSKKYHSDISIKLCTDSYQPLTARHNNQCFLSRVQVSSYLHQLTKIYPFKYNVRNGSYYNHPCYIVHLDIMATRAVTTIIVQSIKKLYEFPQNYYLAQAYKMQHLPKFRFDNIQNLFMAVASCYESEGDRDHVFGICRKFLTIDQMRKRIEHITYARQLYPDYTKYYNLKVHQVPDYKTEYITENALFEKHLPQYINNYRILKAR